MWARVRDYSAKLRDCVTLCCGLLRIQFLTFSFYTLHFPLGVLLVVLFLGYVLLISVFLSIIVFSMRTHAHTCL